MERYDFEIVNGKERTVVERGVAIDNPRAVWPRVASIAQRINAPGRLIRVSNAAGKIVVLVGVATALQLCADILNNLPG
jgi:hypothetical protein